MTKVIIFDMNKYGHGQSLYFETCHEFLRNVPGNEPITMLIQKHNLLVSIDDLKFLLDEVNKMGSLQYTYLGEEEYVLYNLRYTKGDFICIGISPEKKNYSTHDKYQIGLLTINIVRWVFTYYGVDTAEEFIHNIKEGKLELISALAIAQARMDEVFHDGNRTFVACTCRVPIIHSLESYKEAYRNDSSSVHFYNSFKSNISITTACHKQLKNAKTLDEFLELAKKNGICKIEN